MTKAETESRVCGCGETFDAEGTLHGHPAALWELLAHRAAGCTVSAG